MREWSIGTDRLFHLADTANVPSILAHGLRSVERLLELTGRKVDSSTDLLRTHRRENVRLSQDVVIRDQRPMPPSALAPALTGGLLPADWYRLLNRHVFFWPSPDRLHRHRMACGSRPQTLLTFDATALLATYGDSAFVSPINSGNARRKAARRGLATLHPYEQWRRTGWLEGSRNRPPAEVLFRCDIPAGRPFLVDLAEI